MFFLRGILRLSWNLEASKEKFCQQCLVKKHRHFSAVNFLVKYKFWIWKNLGLDSDPETKKPGNSSRQHESGPETLIFSRIV